jgi:hypothetical protein
MRQSRNGILKFLGRCGVALTRIRHNTPRKGLPSRIWRPNQSVPINSSQHCKIRCTNYAGLQGWISPSMPASQLAYAPPSIIRQALHQQRPPEPMPPYAPRVSICALACSVPGTTRAFSTITTLAGRSGINISMCAGCPLQRQLRHWRLFLPIQIVIEITS